ncbi:MAG: XdhC family protein [Coriobacteriia bacterium]|nr:XdhC family protein [Coriobacteriia bacterium]
MNKQDLIAIIEDLEDGYVPTLTPELFPAFSPEALAGNGYVQPEYLEVIAQSLTKADIPTFQRAIRAMDEGDLAWLGFKVVYDPEAAVANVDNEVTKKYGEQGSADGEPLVFFCNDAKEIVASREWSPRDAFQMKDVTRGPSMHNEQFDGLTWLSASLFQPVRVWLLGASDSASEVSALAKHVGFDVVVLDYDPAYLNEDRFPGVERYLLRGGNFDDLADFTPSPDDYVCVLTRGHMFDPQGCIWAKKHGVHYVGMMGCKGKNNTVYDLVRAAGLTDEDWDTIKRPIGLKFGAKTPAELAIAIVAELVDVRYKQRYSEAARAKHEDSLGR